MSLLNTKVFNEALLGGIFLDRQPHIPSISRRGAGLAPAHLWFVSLFGLPMKEGEEEQNASRQIWAVYNGPKEIDC